MDSNTRKKKSHKPFSTSSLNLFPSSENLLPSSKADFCRLITVLSVAAVVVMTCNIITNSVNQPQKPFCDTTASDYDDSLSDYCEPCPKNGICYDGKLQCEHGYRKHGKVCVEDGDVNEAAKKLSKWMEVRVCEAGVQLLCSGIGDCWVSDDELWNDLPEYKTRDNYGLEEAIYMLAKQRAMENIRNSLETRVVNHGIEEFKCPELLVDHYKPLSCSVRQWIIKHLLVLVPACALFTGCILIAFRTYKQFQLSVRAEQLYHEVCDILEEKPFSSRTINGEVESWVVASWLRDHLLLPRERKNPSLWKKVEELVREDSRVDQYPKLLKGEYKVVWEWQALQERREVREDLQNWKNAQILPIMQKDAFMLHDILCGSKIAVGDLAIYYKWWKSNPANPHIESL